MSGRGGKQGIKTTPRSKSWRVKNHDQHSRNRQAYVTKRDLHGGKFSPSTNPPDVTYQPWNSVTLVHSFSQKFDCQTKTLIEQLRTQLDPEKRGFNQTTSGDRRFVVQMKIYSIQAWNLTGRMLALTVDDYSEARSAAGGRDQLVGIVDTGTQSHTPCVGYLLPASHRQMVLRTDDKQGEDYIYTLIAGGTDQCIVYTRISYRFDGPVQPPRILMPIGTTIKLLGDGNRTVNRVSVQVNGLKEILKRLQEISENTYESRPSTVEKIIDKVKYVAMAVAALGEGECSSFEDLASYMDDVTLDEPPMPLNSDDLGVETP